jgi:hypothetical protein
MATARKPAGSTRASRRFLSYSPGCTACAPWPSIGPVTIGFTPGSRYDTVPMHDLGPLCSRDNWTGFVAGSDSPAATPRLHLRFDVWHGGRSRTPPLIRRNDPVRPSLAATCPPARLNLASLPSLADS